MITTTSTSISARFLVSSKKSRWSSGTDLSNWTLTYIDYVKKLVKMWPTLDNFLIKIYLKTEARKSYSQSFHVTFRPESMAVSRLTA